MHYGSLHHESIRQIMNHWWIAPKIRLWDSVKSFGLMARCTCACSRQAPPSEEWSGWVHAYFRFMSFTKSLVGSSFWLSLHKSRRREKKKPHCSRDSYWLWLRIFGLIMIISTTAHADPRMLPQLLNASGGKVEICHRSLKYFIHPFCLWNQHREGATIKDVCRK